MLGVKSFGGTEDLLERAKLWVEGEEVEGEELLKGTKILEFGMQVEI
ncbi:unnamed protein product, partial [Allacma fusca]